MRLANLCLTAVICGFAMMALEILGGRFLQPTFGSGIDVWAAVICVFILSLSIGYVLGGRAADRLRGSGAVGRIILAASVFYLLMPVYGRPIIEALGPAVHRARWGSLLAATLLFLPPSALLGCVSPMLVTLATPSARRLGEMTGLLYAAGCVGNVLGVLVSDYVLLAAAPLNVNLLAMGVLLAAAGLWHALAPVPSTLRRPGRVQAVRSAVLLAAVLLSGAAGWAFQDPPHRLGRPGLPADETLIAHRDSPYAHISWVASRSGNYAQLRFFDKSQGAVCLRPRWDEYAALADGLEHLRMPASLGTLRERPLNPGALVNALYVALYPSGALLNERLMERAGGEPRRASPRVLMFGLGAGAGVSIFAHHFPQASVLVVELDPAVVALVRERYPLLGWLETQRTVDGRPRLRIATGDARRLLREERRGGRRYDLAVLDAYGLGSTIPPHLMTREFYQEIGEALEADGLLVSNIPGSYEGARRKLLGGAMRSMLAAGFAGVVNVPVLLPEEAPARFNRLIARSNIVVAGRRPGAAPGSGAWRRLEAFVPYPELPTGRFLSRFVSLTDGRRYLTSKVAIEEDGWPLDGQALEALQRERIDQQQGQPFRQGERLVMYRPDLAAQAAAAVRRRGAPHLGWDRAGSAAALVYEQTDWVAFVREMFQAGLRAGAVVELIDGALVASAPPAGPWPGEAPAPASWELRDAPLFTDAQPNADLYDR